MPQPIRLDHPIAADFGVKALLHRPKLATLIALTATHWNDLEARIAVFIAALLQQEANTVMTIFLALTGDGPKRALMDAVASMKLKSEDLTLFQKVQSNISGRYGERNKIIHGAWGVSPDYPDQLLLGDFRDSISYMSGVAAGGLNDPFAFINKTLEHQRKWQVWKEQDFLDVLSRMESARAELDQFTMPYISPFFSGKLTTTS